MRFSLKTTVFILLSLFAENAPANDCEGLLAGNRPREIHLTRTLKTNDIAAIRLREGDQHLTSEIVSALSKADWNHPVLAADQDRPAVLRSALQAYREGSIGQDQLATLLLHWTADLQFGWATKGIKLTLPLIDQTGRLTPIAWKVFSDPLGKKSLNRLTPMQSATFQYVLNTLAPSERYLWILRIPEEFIKNATEDWRTGMESLGGGSVLSHFLREDWDWGDGSNDTALILPSFGALQAHLTARFGKNAIKLIPQLGLQNFHEVLQGVSEGGRVFALQFPGVKGNESAHGQAGELTAAYHDWFHAWMGSNVAVEYRRLIPRVMTISVQYRELLRLTFEGKEMPLEAAHQVAGTQNKWIDLNVSYVDAELAKLAGMPPHPMPNTFAEAVYNDFSIRALSLVAFDVARNPRFYRERGIDTERFIEELQQIWLVRRVEKYHGRKDFPFQGGPRFVYEAAQSGDYVTDVPEVMRAFDLDHSVLFDKHQNLFL